MRTSELNPVSPCAGHQILAGLAITEPALDLKDVGTVPDASELPVPHSACWQYLTLMKGMALM